MALPSNNPFVNVVVSSRTAYLPEVRPSGVSIFDTFLHPVEVLPREALLRLTFARNVLIYRWRTHSKQLPHLGDLRFADGFTLSPLLIGLPGQAR